MVPGVGLIFTSRMRWKTVFNTVFRPLANFSQVPPGRTRFPLPMAVLPGPGRGSADRSYVSFSQTAVARSSLVFPSLIPTERDWLWLVTRKAKLWLSGCVIYSSGCQSANESSFPKIKQRVLIINLEQINAFALIHMEQGQFTALPDLPAGFFVHRFISVSFLRKCLLFAFSENLIE